MKGELKLMGNNKLTKLVAKGTVNVLNTHLRDDANAASCAIIFQPKVPEELSKFKEHSVKQKR